MKLDTAKVRKLCAAKFGSKPGDANASHGQAELAKCASISPVTLSRLLNNRTKHPSPGTLGALAGALDVEPAELLLESEADQLRAKALAQGVEL